MVVKPRIWIIMPCVSEFVNSLRCFSHMRSAHRWRFRDYAECAQVVRMEGRPPPRAGGDETSYRIPWTIRSV